MADAVSLDRLAIESLVYETDPHIRKIREILKNLDARFEGINIEIRALHQQINSLKKNP